MTAKKRALKFSVNDIIDLRSLARKLFDKSDVFSRFLSEQMGPVINDLLITYLTANAKAEPLQHALLKELNKFVLGQRFSGEATRNISLRAETAELQKKKPTESALARLNRMLIEDAYPLELENSHKIFRPKYLTLENLELSKPIAAWMGRQLAELRKSRSPESIAEQVGGTVEEIEMLERGQLYVKCGRLQQILLAYKTTLPTLLERSLTECADIYKLQKIKYAKSQYFKRKLFYSVRLIANFKLQATPMFMGGDPSSYIWAVPIRKLEADEVSVEYLELAQKRFKKDQGKTKENTHPGTEVIFVIRGAVNQFIAKDGEDDYQQRPLSRGDLIHFDSSKSHFVENASDQSTAFLLVIR